MTIANPQLIPWAFGMCVFMVTILAIALKEARRR